MKILTNIPLLNCVLFYIYIYSIISNTRVGLISSPESIACVGAVAIHLVLSQFAMFSYSKPLKSIFIIYLLFRLLEYSISFYNSYAASNYINLWSTLTLMAITIQILYLTFKNHQTQTIKIKNSIHVMYTALSAPFIIVLLSYDTNLNTILFSILYLALIYTTETHKKSNIFENWIQTISILFILVIQLQIFSQSLNYINTFDLAFHFFCIPFGLILLVYNLRYLRHAPPVIQ